MSYYNGDHSLIIGDKHTWTDWHLIPTTRPSVTMPSIRTKFIEIPGAFGSLDLTELLTGCPVFGDRSGSWEFVMDPDREDKVSWANLAQTIAMYIHGRRHRVILTDDPEYCYEGRLALGDLQPDKEYTLITINYQLDPYKVPTHDPFSNWLWDPFDFETGVIGTEGGTVTVSGSQIITVSGMDEEFSPAIKVSAPMTLTYDGRKYSLITGTNYVHEIVLGSGNHSLTFTGNGTVAISKMGARL